jgi:hypothetical protein
MHAILFLLLNNIPLYGYNTFCLFIHQCIDIDIWIAAILGDVNNASILYTALILWGRYLGVQVLMYV